MADTETITRTREDTALDVPWNVVVHDDPVNLMGYVTWVLMKLFGYNEQKAAMMMMQVHKQGAPPCGPASARKPSSTPNNSRATNSPPPSKRPHETRPRT